MNNKLLASSLPEVYAEDIIDMHLVDDCNDSIITSIEPPPVDDMTTTVLRATEETQ